MSKREHERGLNCTEHDGTCIHCGKKYNFRFEWGWTVPDGPCIKIGEKDMYHIPDRTGQPPCYGGPPPGTWLLTLDGKMICLIRVEKIEDTSPQRYKAYTTYRYLDEIKVYPLMRFRSRLQIQIDGSSFLSGNHEVDLVKVLSCSEYDSDNEDEHICIELEHSGRKDGRLTDDELAYIREPDEK